MMEFEINGLYWGQGKHKVIWNNKKLKIAAFEIADRKCLKGKSMGKGLEFKITGILMQPSLNLQVQLYLIKKDWKDSDVVLVPSS